MKVGNYFRCKTLGRKLSFAKHALLFALILFSIYWSNSIFSQTNPPRGLSINATNADPDPSAIVDISSNSKGLLIPRMSTSEILAIATPAEGLTVYDTDKDAFFYYSGAAWKELAVATGVNWFLSGSNAYLGNTGNLGLGTGTPSAKFHIERTLQEGNYFRITGSGTNILNINSDGDIGWGNAPLLNSGANLYLSRHGGGGTAIAIQNTHAQNYARFLLKNELGTGMTFVTTNTGFPAANNMIANNSYIFSDNTLNIETNTGSPIIFYTNNQQAMRINNGGNVGIGAASPINLLELSSKLISIPSAITYDKAGVDYFTAGVDTSGNFKIVTGSNINEPSNLKMMITQNGLIGIGTSSPSRHVEIVRNGNNNTEIQVTNTTNGTGAVTHIIAGMGTGTSKNVELSFYSPLHASTNYADAGVLRTEGAVMGGIAISTGTPSPIKFFTNETLRAIINSTGNFGIGTSSPTAKLHIGGVAGTDGIRFPDGTLQTTAATGGPSQWTTSGNNIYNSNSGNVGIGTTIPVAMLSVNGTDVSNTNFSMKITSPSLTDPISFAIRNDGFIGVGHDAPQEFIHLKQNDPLGSHFLTETTNASSFASYQVMNDAGYKGLFWIDGSSRNIYGGTNSVNIGTVTSTNFSIVTSNVSRLLVDGTGNIGIGITSPTAKLHIGGVAGTDGIRFPDGTLQTTAAASGPSQWTTSGNNIYNNNSGNVGIGTTSPLAKLYVSGGDTYFSPGGVNTTTIITDASGHGNIQLKNSSGVLKVDLWGHSGGAAGSYFHQPIFIDQDFSVNVQHTSNGVQYFNGSNANGNVISLSDYFGHGRARLFQDGVATATVDLNASGDSYFNGGNVGIGTISPAAGLDVNGTAKFAGDVTLGSNTSLKQASGTSSLSFDATGLSNVTGLGYNLGSSATAQGLVVAPIGTTGYPNGVVALTDPNFDGQIMLSLGSGNTGTRINMSGSEKKIVLQNDGGDKLTMGGVNGFTTWESTQGVRIMPRAGFTNTANPMFYVEGDITATGTVTQNSDITLKKDIEQLDNALNKILQLRGVSYYWKSNEKDQSRQIGFIAQEIEKIYPELVREDKDGIKSVNYAAMVAPLIEAIKEQQKIIDEQKEKIKELESGNAMMSEQVKNLRTMESRLSALESLMKQGAGSASKK